MEAVSVDQFVQRLRKSELLSAEKVQLVEQAGAKAKHGEHLARFLVRQKLLTPWQAGQLLVNRPTFMLGKYRLIDLLGKGGMGTVFLAEHVTMNRRVALKIVPRGLENNPAAMERFMAEARAIATVDHPNIVQAYSVDNESDRYFIVMEYVDGRDLERIVTEDGPLDYARAADYIRQAAEGLAHAHGRGMIHCDIKPSNLLVNSQGVVKILDLGLARLSGEDEDEKPAKGNDHVLGTVDYMAPEQGLNAKTFDHRADLYSLGCTLYFLLVAHPPFPEGTLAQRIVKHQSQSPASIIEKRPDAPPQLVRICRKMMAKDPKDRYQSAEDVVRALSELNLEQNIKRAVPLDQIATEETPGVDSVNVATLESAVEAAPQMGVATKPVLLAKRAKPRRPVNLAPLVMWGVIGLVAALIVTGVVAVMLLKKTVSADSDSERPRIVLPVHKTAPRKEAPSRSGFPSLNPDSTSDSRPTPSSPPGAPSAPAKAAANAPVPSKNLTSKPNAGAGTQANTPPPQPAAKKAAEPK